MSHTQNNDFAADMHIMALIAENPAHFMITPNGQIAFAQHNRFPLIAACIQDFANRHQHIAIRHLQKKEQEQASHAFILDGVIRAIYADGDLNAREINPTAVAAMLQETGLRRDQFINGRVMGVFLRDFDRVESILSFQLSPKKMREKAAKAADKMKKILIMRESGLVVSKELEEWEQRNKKSLNFSGKSEQEKMEIVENALVEIFQEHVDKIPKPTTEMVRGATSLDDALAQTIKPIFRLPEPPDLENALRARQELSLSI